MGNPDSQPASKSVGGVTQASYQTPASSAPPLALAAATSSTGDRYKNFEATTSNAEPAYGASSPSPLQQARIPIIRGERRRIIVKPICNLAWVLQPPCDR